MSETPFYFGNEGQRLFAVLHSPDSSSESGTGLVLCHAFAEEKLWAHRAFVNCARRLARAGHNVLRFDYRGYGDSDGRFEDSTVDSQVSDTQAALRALRDKCPELKHVGLLGLRFGATIACLAAESDGVCDRLALLDPVTDLREYIHDALRSHLTTQMVMYGKIVMNRDQLVEAIQNGELINIDGYDIGKKFYDSAMRYEVFTGEKSYTGPCLILDISRKEKPVAAKTIAFAGTFRNAECQQAIEEPFWKETKIFVQDAVSINQAVVQWLETCA